MKSSLKKQAERFLREQKNYRRWLAVFLCLAVVVTIGTTAALKYKGIAVTGDAEVSEEMHMEQAEEIPEGMRRHVHTEACYEEQPVLVCEAAKTEAESTDSDAVDAAAQTGTTAGAAEPSDTGAASEAPKPAETTEAASGHTHSDSCYQVTGGVETLTCTTEEHTHGDGCYETKTVTETVTKTVPENVTKEVTDEEGNVSTVMETVDKTVEETVEKEEKVLTCGKSEHSHGDSCYTVEDGEKTLVCTVPVGAGTEEGTVSAPAEAVVENTEAEAPAAEPAAVENTGAEEAAAEESADAAAENTDAEEAAEESTDAATENTDAAADNAGEDGAAVENTESGASTIVDAEETAGDHIHGESCYELQMVLICGKEEGELEPIDEFQGGVQECVAGNVKVIAAYGPEAEIPADAVLQARQITAEEDPEYYAEREAEYLAETGEDAVLDMLLDIGFYVNGTEIEPKAAVSITIEMLDDVYEDGEELNVIHFGSEETEKLDASEVETNEEGNKTTKFETSSFSTFAIGAASVAAGELVSGTEYLIYVQNGNTVTALSHKDNVLGVAAGVTINSENELVTIPSGYEKKDFLWKYVVDGDSKYLQYKTDEGDQKIQFNTSLSSWGIGTDAGNTALTFTSANDGGIYILRQTNRQKNYLSVGNSGITNVTNGRNSTAWTFAKAISDTYTVRYWENKENVASFKDPVSTLSGPYATEELQVTENGKIEIPVRDSVGEKNVGKLDDYTNGGNTYKFYGWSLKKDANYQQTVEYNIYCGDPTVKINGVQVPTYVSTGVIELDAREIEGDTIDVYATWAAPSRAEGSTGVTYYGAGQTDEDKARGVVFYVRLDGELPDEPANANDTSQISMAHYTAGVYASNNGTEVKNPLNYWMHIYGNGNEKAIEANLLYRPTNDDIYEAVKSVIKEGKEVKVAGKTLTSNDIGANAGEFAKKYYVKWYVCKDENGYYVNGSWHIDGVLLKKNLWDLVYADPNKTIQSGALIPERQYGLKEEDNNTATVHNTLVGAKDSNVEPIRKGWTFAGWNTGVDGNGVPFTAEDQITVDNEGQVYKKINGTWAAVDGLEAAWDENIWKVTLYPQWERITNAYKIEKAWVGETLINPLVKSIRIKITRATITEGDNGKEVETPDPAFEEFVTLESSKQWKGTTSELPDTDVQGNDYKYYMEEVSASGDDGEIGGVTQSYVLTYEKGTVNRIYSLTNTLREGKIVKITVKKTDADTSPLEGAVFKLSLKESKEGEGIWTVISDNYTSDGSGIVINKGALVEGEYRLEEVASPAGYEKNTGVIEFKVMDKGTEGSPNMVVEPVGQNVDEWSFDGTNNTFTVKNVASTMSVTLKKVSGENPDGGDRVGLNGAEFVVVNSEDKYLAPENSEKKWMDSETEARKIVTAGEGENIGTAIIPELPAGTYYLKEVKAPDGYNLRTDTIPFEIKLDTVTKRLVLSEATGAVYEGVEIKSTGGIIQVTNSTGVELPETGGPGTAAYTFGGLAMIFAVSLMYGLNMRRKRGKGGLN